MSDDLDPNGLEAALREFGKCWNEPLPFDKAVAGAIRAYLAAIEPENEPDRIAVVVAFESDEVVAEPLFGDEHMENMRERWRFLENQCISPGPFRRQIIRCHLLRPEPVAEIEGVSEYA